MDIIDLEKIMETHPTLNTIGFGLSNCTRYNSVAERRAAMVQHRSDLLDQLDICERVSRWLRESTKAVVRINRNYGSYTWKHIAEKEIGTYVSNGAFIAAAIFCGYKCESFGEESPNAYFNIATHHSLVKKRSVPVFPRL